MLIKNHLQLLEKLYKRKEGIADAYKLTRLKLIPTFSTIPWTFAFRITE